MTFGLASLNPSAGKKALAKERQTLTTDELIAEKAVELIPENARYIGLDCGSSVGEVAKQIINLPSVKTIVPAQYQPSANLFRRGPWSDHPLFSMVDPWYSAWSNQPWRHFFESSGVLKHNGLCANNFTDAAMKHQLMNRSSMSVALFSHELFEATSLVETVPWSCFDHVIADSKTLENIIEEIRLKTDLIIVQ